jgi:sugar-specific transcriptional regulator TrmB
LNHGGIHQTLRSFGLTEKETELYTFLGKHEALKGGEITRQLKMNKGQVYRLLQNLQKKGFVEATLEHPTRFIPVPFEKVIDLFIKSKREEISLIEKTKKDLINEWAMIQQIKLDSTKEKFSVIEGEKTVYNKISQMVKETKNKLRVISNVSGLLKAEQFGIFDNIVAHPLKLNIKFRYITEITKANYNVLQLLLTKLKTGIDLKGKIPEMEKLPFPRMVIRDNEEIILFISDQSKPNLNEETQTGLYTNCKSIIQAFSRVFEDLWKNATDIKQKIVEIETGKQPNLTQIIKDPKLAENTFNNIIISAKKEILIVTSSNGLKTLLEERIPVQKLRNKDVIINIMAPVTSENIVEIQKIMEYCEVRHIPIGFFETTIIDDKHIFQFNKEITSWSNEKSSFFKDIFYSNDSNYIRKTKNMLNDIWKKTRIPQDLQFQENLTPTHEIKIHLPLMKCERYGLGEIEYKDLGKIGKKDVLDKFNYIHRNASRNWSNTKWSDTLYFLGTRALASFQLPDRLGLPKLLFMVFQNTEASSFGAEKILKIFMQSKMTTNSNYELVAHIQDNPKSIEFRKQLLRGIPGGKNIISVKKGQLNVRLQGSTLFAGWTINIPLIPSNHVLPPSSIMFEKYGDEKSGRFNFMFPSGRKQDVWFNSNEAFVTFFHPSSRFIGPGTEGCIDTNSVQISYPPGHVLDT